MPEGAPQGKLPLIALRTPLARLDLLTMRLLGPVVAALLAVVIVSTASGHSEPERVFPGSGAVLVEPPTEVVLVMTKEMLRQAGANDIDVGDAEGREVTEVAASIDNADRRRLSVPVPAAFPPGETPLR